MSNATTMVLVPTVCSRTGKKKNISLPLEEVGNYTDAQQQKQVVAATLEGLLAQSVEEGTPFPDLVLYWKGHLTVMPSVHTSSHDAISRYANAILKKDLYPVAPAKPRKAKGASDDAAEGDEPAVDVAEDEA